MAKHIAWCNGSGSLQCVRVSKNNKGVRIVSTDARGERSTSVGVTMSLDDASDFVDLILEIIEEKVLNKELSER